MIISAIKRAYKQLEDKNWDKIYWAIDIHGTCLESNYKSGEFQLINEDVIKTLRVIQSLPESVLIMWTSAYTQDLYALRAFFELHGVKFNYLGINPEVENTKTGNFHRKFYFSVLLDDKAGFDPDTDWKLIHTYLTT